MQNKLPMHLCRQCGARTRSGSRCRSAAMLNGRCQMHGGMSPGAPKGNKKASSPRLNLLPQARALVIGAVEQIMPRGLYKQRSSTSRMISWRHPGLMTTKTPWAFAHKYVHFADVQVPHRPDANGAPARERSEDGGQEVMKPPKPHATVGLLVQGCTVNRKNRQ
jgi:hypothetical protein